MHRDYIADLEAYKREPDSFYFHQVCSNGRSARMKESADFLEQQAL
jgi:hypothetical protein